MKISEIVFKSYLRNAIFFNLKGLLDIDAKRYYSERISKYGYLEKRKDSWIYNIAFFILIYGIWNMDTFVYKWRYDF